MAAFSRQEIERIFGKFTYTEGKGGRILPDPAWVREHIVEIKLPYADSDEPRIKRVQCHKLVAPSLVNAFDELDTAGLLHVVRTLDGCWVPRHVLWDKRKPLSSHAYGIAIDLNARLFPYGSSKLQDPRLVKIMARHGFLFGQIGGGLWVSTRDPMHAEYCWRGVAK